MQLKVIGAILYTLFLIGVGAWAVNEYNSSEIKDLTSELDDKNETIRLASRSATAAIEAKDALAAQQLLDRADFDTIRTSIGGLRNSIRESKQNSNITGDKRSEVYSELFEDCAGQYSEMATAAQERRTDSVALYNQILGSK